MREIHPIVGARLIDDLVSGQLAGERYRAALRALDAEPRKWRDCALAFLEEQALRSELSAMAQGTIAWPDERVSREHNSTAVFSSATPVVGGAVRGPGNLSLSKPHWLSGGLLSTAALLMISFTLGWLGSEVLAERQQAVARSTGNTLVDSVAKSQESLRLQGAPSSAARPGVASPSITPQYVLGQPGGFMPLDREVPRQIRELERQGKVLVESLDGLMPATLSDGSSVLIPVQEYRLLPATISY